MFFLQACSKSAEIFASSLQTEALLPGTSDTIIVKHKSGHYKCTPFLACFGPYAVLSKTKKVNLSINGTLISDLKFQLDRHGYSYPMYPSDKDIRKMGLKFGKNQIVYELQGHKLKAEVHLFTDNDKILISDVDGTLTKNDIGGLISNTIEKDFLHEGYAELIRKIAENGYKIVWITMRSLPMYQFSKKYIQNTVGVSGALITEPQQFLPAIKKEIFKKTGNIKANLMKEIKKLFPQKSEPFIGGLGNRQNDAIAYYHAGIDLKDIFIIDTKSYVHKMDTPAFGLTYKQMIAQLEDFFPKYHAMRIGY